MNILAELFSFKFIILYIFIISGTYAQLRGKVRLKFSRQLLDQSTLLGPINILMYLFSAVPNKPFMNLSEFPHLDALQTNWKMIRDEAENLLAPGHIKASDKYDDGAFNSFFRTGWKRFYLKWYDDSLPSAKALCPKTVELLKTIPEIKGAMFALLPKGAHLGKHRDPYAGSLRYHLGLITPNSEQCCIHVDGIKHVWKDGEGVLFDETFIHWAQNETDQDRIILFCDVERPLTNRVMTKINYLFSKYVMSESATQNLETDRIGFLNRIFKYVYQIRIVGTRLKSYNRTLYYSVKYMIFISIFYAIFLR